MKNRHYMVPVGQDVDFIKEEQMKLVDLLKEQKHILSLRVQELEGYQDKYIAAQSEIASLKKEIRKQDEALTKSAADDQLVVLLLKKYINELESRLEG